MCLCRVYIRRKLSTSESDDRTQVVMKVRPDEHLVLSKSQEKNSKTKGSVFDLSKMKLWLPRVVCFTKTISQIEVAINSNVVYSVSKTSKLVQEHSIKQNKKNRPAGIGASHLHQFFQVSSILESTQEIVVKDSTQEIAATEKKSKKVKAPLKASSLLLRHFRVVCDVSLQEDYHSKVRRIIKKDLPKKTELQMLFPTDLSSIPTYDPLATDPLRSVLPVCRTQDGYAVNGQVFVGLATHQTTGTGCHIHAQLIPTIERENIDFQDNYLGKWNSDLMSLMGQMCRFVYDISTNSTSIDKETATALMIANSFQPSHPSADVGSYLVQGFFDRKTALRLPMWDQAKKKMILRDSTETFLPAHGIEDFVNLPVLENEIYDVCKPFFVQMLKRGLISVLTLDLATNFIKDQVMSSIQLAALLKWLCKVRNDLFTPPKFKAFVGAIQWHAPDSKVRAWKNVKFFQQSGGCSILPESVLPLEISKELSHKKMADLDLKPLPFAQWLSFVLGQEELLTSSAYVPQILSYMSQHAGLLSTKEWKHIIGVLSQLPCIPTATSMQFPRDVYLPSKHLPSHLPRVNLPLTDDAEDTDGDEKDDTMEENMDAEDKTEKIRVRSSFLVKLGVRNSPSLNVLLESQVRQSGPSSNKCAQKIVTDFLKQKEHMTELDWSELSSSQFLPGVEYKDLEKKDNKTQLFLPSDLHFPSVANALSPGLPVVAWSDLTIDSDAGQFLKKLGVREVPALSKMLDMCAHEQEEQVGQTKFKALTFFLSKFQQFYASEYRALDRAKKITTKFLSAVCPTSASSVSNRKASTCKKRARNLVNLVSENDTDSDDDAVLLVATQLKQEKTNQAEQVLVTPTQCFAHANPIFPMLSVDVKALCEANGVDLALLGVHPHPTLEQSFKNLQTCPPTEESAAEVFGYLHRHAEGFKQSILEAIMKTPIVPCNGHLRRPNEVFVRDDGEIEQEIKGSKKRKRPSKTKKAAQCSSDLNLDGLVCFVDYGPEGNSFLKACGTTSSPSPTQLAELLMDKHEEYLSLSGQDRSAQYLQILKELASTVSQIDKKTQQKMKNSKWALAFRNPDKTEESSSESSSNARVCSIVEPRECFLIDDHSLERILNPWCAPDDQQLCGLYEKFGASWLSKAVVKKSKAFGSREASRRAVSVQNLIQERLPMLLVDRRRQKLTGITKKAEEKLRNLSVTEVKSIKMTITFQVNFVFFVLLFFSSRYSSQSFSAKQILEQTLKIHTHSGNVPYTPRNRRTKLRVRRCWGCTMLAKDGLFCSP